MMVNLLRRFGLYPLDFFAYELLAGLFPKQVDPRDPLTWKCP